MLWIIGPATGGNRHIYRNACLVLNLKGCIVIYIPIKFEWCICSRSGREITGTGTDGLVKDASGIDTVYAGMEMLTVGISEIAGKFKPGKTLPEHRHVKWLGTGIYCIGCNWHTCLL
ncbi:hypothetical protein D9M68_700670 [compost metagenome]